MVVSLNSRLESNTDDEEEEVLTLDASADAVARARVADSALLTIG